MPDPGAVLFIVVILSAAIAPLADPLTLLVHPSEGTGESTLYEDAGDGFGYERGEYARRGVICEVRGGTITVRLGAREGSFVSPRESMHLELRGMNTCPNSVSANGEEADWDYDEADGRITVRLAESAVETPVEASFQAATTTDPR